jgi:hypothetical protein
MEGLIYLILLVVAVVQWWKARRLGNQLETRVRTLTAQNQQLQAELETLNAELQSLHPYAQVRDAAAEATRIVEQARQSAAQALADAQQEVKTARGEADRLRQAALKNVRDKRQQIEHQLAEAGIQAQKIIEEAQRQAQAIGGDAYRALQEADTLAARIQAMKNVIDGYGDRYIVPTHSLIDELAGAYSHADAGQELRKARERTTLMVSQGRAAHCDYAEKNRRETAIRFVVDAFNGKVDSILTRAKVDNFGTLQQEIRDAAALVNANGGAFRNAQVLPEYVDARIEELKWAVRAIELKERDKEEQRRIREQIREEERARREYERAMKEAAREEELVRRALEKAQGQMLKASEENRQKFETQIQQLQQRLTEAEQKNERAKSMAQQTKAGHVYVISNIGSFGEQVYKIGMTRRLEPLDRVRELGDASVPFPFDVHALIWSDHALHRQFLQAQLNKVNPRKEFFKVGLADVRAAIEAMGLQATWTMAAEAREYRESLATEQRIASDTAAREAWLREQMLYEAEAVDEEAEAVAEVASHAEAAEETA